MTIEIDRSGDRPLTSQSGTEWFGQPRGLTILFLTDMWEQFSYYGMRSLLVYYLVNELLIGQERASLTYGVYTAFVYFTPILGGLLADRWLGRRRAVLIGGTIMAAGHFMMAFESSFYLALATIAIGNGLFLPNLPSQIDTLYAHNDPRRKSAFNIFYVGVNVGAFLAPFVCGTIGEIYGWHWGFTVAGVGMILGLFIYIAGARYLPADVLVERSASDSSAAAADRAFVKQRFMLLIGVALVVVVLRGAYEQVGNTVALWTAATDRNIGTFTIPMTWFVSLNPMLVMLLTPWLVMHWTRLAKRAKEPSSISKMSMGMAVIAGSYLILAGSAAWSDAHGTPSGWLWLLAFFTVMTIGELFVLPIGLGLFGRLAPKGYAGTGIALWFFAGFLGNLLAGAVGTLWSRFEPDTFFILTATIAAVAAVLLHLFNRSVSQADT